MSLKERLEAIAASTTQEWSDGDALSPADARKVLALIDAAKAMANPPNASENRAQQYRNLVAALAALEAE